MQRQSGARDAAVIRYPVRPGRLRRRWAGPAALLEQAAGKPLSALVQGRPGHGTTLGGGVSGGSSPASPALVRQIRMIDMKKPAVEGGSGWSPETIARRISAGYDQTRAALEETPLMA